MKSLICGAASIAVACGWAFAASAATSSARPHIDPAGWVIAPGEAACRTELELTGRSGAVSPVSLISDGGQIRLRFAMEEAPERAFLPIRIDQKAYPNLVLRGDVPKVAIMALSDETLAAMRKGRTLQVAWLSEEPVRVSLAGASQAIADLRTCGAQVSAQHRARLDAQEQSRARAAQESRTKALADEQLAAARAQRSAAEAQRQRLAAEADRATAQAQQAQAEAQRQRAMAYADQQRAEIQRRRAYAGYTGYAVYDDEDDARPQWVPPRPVYTYRPYDPRYDR